MKRLILRVLALGIAAAAQTAAGQANQQQQAAPSAIAQQPVPAERAQVEADAEAGDVKAQVQLGAAYLASRKYDEAAKWFSKAADQGDAGGQTALGDMYRQGLAGKHTPEENTAEAVRLFTLAARQNYGPGQAALGTAYFTGYGVAKDLTEAVRLMRAAAEQGVAGAQFVLGSLYEQGNGVPANTREAVKWYRMAAAKNSPQALNNLAWLEVTSSDGCFRDVVLGVEHAQLAVKTNGGRAAAYYDTLARAQYESGSPELAVKSESRALQLAESMAMRDALARYQKAADSGAKPPQVKVTPCNEPKPSETAEKH